MYVKNSVKYSKGKEQRSTLKQFSELQQSNPLTEFLLSTAVILMTLQQRISSEAAAGPKQVSQTGEDFFNRKQPQESSSTGGILSKLQQQTRQEQRL